MSLWTLGFRIWSTYKTATVITPGIALAALIGFVQGPTLLFWIIASVTLGVFLGARLVLVDLARREGADKPPTTVKARR